MAGIIIKKPTSPIARGTKKPTTGTTDIIVVTDSGPTFQAASSTLEAVSLYLNSLTKLNGSLGAISPGQTFLPVKTNRLERNTISAAAITNMPKQRARFFKMSSFLSLLNFSSLISICCFETF